MCKARNVQWRCKIGSLCAVISGVRSPCRVPAGRLALGLIAATVCSAVAPWCASAEELAPSHPVVQRESAWMLTVPKGWRRTPQKYIDDLNTSFESQNTFGEIRTRFLSAYEPEVSDGSFVIVSVLPIPLRGASYKSFETTFGSVEFEGIEEFKKRAFITMKVNQSATPLVLDRRACELVSFSYDKLDNGALLYRVRVGKPGADGVVFIEGSAPKELFDERRADFDAFVSSIRFQPGHEFVPVRDPISLPRLSQADMINIARVASIAAIVVLFPILIIRRMRGKSREAAV